MHRFNRLTVALSRTDPDADAALLRYAAAIARLGTATAVRFVHALSPDVPDGEDARRAMQAEVAVSFTNVPASVTRYFDILRGPMLDQLLEHAAATRADLLLLGHQPSHPGRRALARRLAMRAPCSVWKVPGGSPAAVTRILVPVDFSEPAGDALRVGASLAKLTGAECLALHVYFNATRVSFEEYDDIRRGQEQEEFEKFVAPLDLSDISVTPLFEESANPAHTIAEVATARGCDLLVMATRGRSRSASILLGSVTEDVLIETKMPLLVVKHQGAQLSAIQALSELVRKRGPQFD
jgi:nucleotide-binding universal stress UspA family protein